MKVITRAKKKSIEKLSENSYKIKVSVPPEKGKANKRVIEILAEELGVRKQDILIVSGLTNSNKIAEIDI